MSNHLTDTPQERAISRYKKACNDLADAQRYYAELDTDSPDRAMAEREIVKRINHRDTCEEALLDMGVET